MHQFGCAPRASKCQNKWEDGAARITPGRHKHIITVNTAGAQASNRTNEKRLVYFRKQSTFTAQLQRGIREVHSGDDQKRTFTDTISISSVVGSTPFHHLSRKRGALAKTNGRTEQLKLFGNLMQVLFPFDHPSVRAWCDVDGPDRGPRGLDADHPWRVAEKTGVKRTTHQPLRHPRRRLLVRASQHRREVQGGPSPSGICRRWD